MFKSSIHSFAGGAMPARRSGAFQPPRARQAPAVSGGTLSAAAGAVFAMWLWLVAPGVSPPEPAVRSAYHLTMQAPRLALHDPRFVQAAAAASAGSRLRADPDREIARLGAHAARFGEPLRERYLKSADLYALLQSVLPDAAAGERASQYYVYLMLGQCQAYLRLDAEGARAMDERVLLELNDRPADERLQWLGEYQRCQGFAGGDLGPLRAAMGEELPGAEVEYASIWFQRAQTAGYPPALAEAALRINQLTAGERRDMLEEAVQSGDPDVYWQLFLNNPGDGAEPVSVAGMAWLILACRNGQDCTRGAEWFRNGACLQEEVRCTPGESAIEHYWYALPAADRENAYALSEQMEQQIAEGRVQRLPWPSLATRSTYGNR